MTTIPQHENETHDELLQSFLQDARESDTPHTEEIRALAASLKHSIAQSQIVLNELAPRPWWKRVAAYISGRTSRLKYINECNHLTLQKTALYLITALAAQNDIVLNKIDVVLEKINRIEQDAALLRAALDAQNNKRTHTFFARCLAPFRATYLHIRNWFTHEND